MDVNVSADLVGELEIALKSGSTERRVRTIQRLSDLLRSCAERLSPPQVGVFDDVLIRLLEHAGIRALNDLSIALADLPAPPQQTVRQLARHDNPAVAGPLLTKSPVLLDAELIEIAKNRSQQHLFAVANRQDLNEEVTDVVLKMAGREASRALARNRSARVSSRGFAILLAAAGRDETIAESLGLRPDLPVAVLRELLSGASETVRARLLKAAPADLKEKIQGELNSIGAKTEPPTHDPTDHSDAHAAVAALSRTGKLNDSTVNRFAIRREYANVVAALSLLSGAGVDTIMPLMGENAGYGLIIACRASRLNWQTTSTVLNNRRVPPLSPQQLGQAKEMFEMLLVSAAQYTIRFEPPGVSNDNAIAVAGGRA